MLFNDRIFSYDLEFIGKFYALKKLKMANIKK